ncbi:hypothetical protein JOB18_036450, partial [Solea senegalensis]
SEQVLKTSAFVAFTVCRDNKIHLSGRIADQSSSKFRPHNSIHTKRFELFQFG